MDNYKFPYKYLLLWNIYKIYRLFVKSMLIYYKSMALWGDFLKHNNSSDDYDFQNNIKPNSLKNDLPFDEDFFKDDYSEGSGHGPRKTLIIGLVSLFVFVLIIGGVVMKHFFEIGKANASVNSSSDIALLSSVSETKNIYESHSENIEETTSIVEPSDSFITQDGHDAENNIDFVTSPINEHIYIPTTRKTVPTTKKVIATTKKITEPQYYSLSIQTEGPGVYRLIGNGEYQPGQNVNFQVYLYDGYEVDTIIYSGLDRLGYSSSVSMNSYDGVAYSITMPANNVRIKIKTVPVATTEQYTTRYYTNATTVPTTKHHTTVAKSTSPPESRLTVRFTADKMPENTNTVNFTWNISSNYQIEDWILFYTVDNSETTYWVVRCADSCKGKYNRFNSDSYEHTFQNISPGQTAHFVMIATDKSGNTVSNPVDITF